MKEIINIALEAGKKIMDIYNSADFGVELKDDNSPLTLADRASNKVIVDRLSSLFPEIPILSEEGRDIPYQERAHWDKFWLVDPLDGTKEFIKKNGEFTVNIALIENKIPTLGVIYAPAYNSSANNSTNEKFVGTLYYTDGKNGSYMQDGITDPILITTSQKNENAIAVKSRSHSSDEEQAVLDKYGVTDSISVGSSLKFCMVAEGKAQIYYRLGPTNEWDVGAGHAIVLGAGGTVEGLSYNKEIILNSSFLVKA